jgi:hypothetical protein
MFGRALTPRPYGPCDVSNVLGFVGMLSYELAFFSISQEAFVQTPMIIISRMTTKQNASIIDGRYRIAIRPAFPERFSTGTFLKELLSCSFMF